MLLTVDGSSKRHEEARRGGGEEEARGGRRGGDEQSMIEAAIDRHHRPSELADSCLPARDRAPNARQCRPFEMTIDVESSIDIVHARAARAFGDCTVKPIRLTQKRKNSRTDNIQDTVSR